MQRVFVLCSLLVIAACSDHKAGNPPGDTLPDGGTAGRVRISGALTPSVASNSIDALPASAQLKAALRAQWKGIIPRASELLSPATASKAPLSERETLPGEVIVRFEEANLSPERAVARMQVEGYSVTHKGYASEYLHLFTYRPVTRSALSNGTQTSAPVPAQTTRALAAQLSGRSGVRSAESNRRVTPQLVPNDTYYPLQWHYPGINLPAAWDITTGDAAVVIAQVDTGMLPHPDIQNRLLPGADFISDISSAGDGNGVDNNPFDEGGDGPNGTSTFHGSHVLGTLAADSNNNKGVAAVNWKARVLPIRALGRMGGTDFDVLAAMTWAGGRTVPGAPFANIYPARVLNLSLGGVSEPSPAYQDVIDTLVANGTVVVVAAGNQAIDAAAYSPCNQQNVICVGALGLSNQRAAYSNFGAPVDVVAPGGSMTEDLNGDNYADGVLSTTWNAQGQANYTFNAGTSMATPHVAGVIALMLAVSPGLSPLQVETILKETASAGGTCPEGCGAGLVNAQAAVVRAKGTSTSPTPKLGVNTTGMQFAATRAQAAPTQNLLVSNLGGGTLSVSVAAQGPQAAQVSFPSGTSLSIGAHATKVLPVKVNTAPLTAGTYTATTLVLTGADSTGLATVRLTIKAGVPLDRDAVVSFAYYKEGTEEWVLVPDGTVTARASANYQYSVDLPVSPTGSYYAVGAIDDDGDGIFHEEGERAGFWRNGDSFDPIPTASGQVITDINFALVPASISVGEINIGGPCTANTGTLACPLCYVDSPGGYCTMPCGGGVECPTGSTCYTISGGGSECRKNCTGIRSATHTCRNQYVCNADGVTPGQGICEPSCIAEPLICGTSQCGSTGYCL